MIALNETNEYAAEIPFTLPLAADPLTGLTGHAFVLGEVQIRLSGVWTNVAVNKIVEKGYGRYCARLTAAQTTAEGIVPIVANVAGSTEQPFFGYETIGTLGGDIAQDGSGYFVFYLPDSTDPVFGAPVTTADFTLSGTLRICLPDDVYRDCTADEKASVVNLGNGGYALPITTAHTAKRGKVFLYAEYTGAQRFESYVTVLGTGTASSPVVTPSTPITVPLTVVTPQSTYKDLINHAINRLCEYSKSGNFEFGLFTDNVGGEGVSIPLDGGLG